jgi:hypothetical protein
MYNLQGAGLIEVSKQLKNPDFDNPPRADNPLINLVIGQPHPSLHYFLLFLNDRLYLILKIIIFT